jgi:hypothetical protein
VTVRRSLGLVSLLALTTWRELMERRKAVPPSTRN